LESIKKPIAARSRALIQVARFAIRDVYDAIAELVTNSDDRYQVVGGSGVIEIEVERHRGKELTLLRVRDFADGMDAGTMDRKLSVMGGRESGLASGEEVRGTHSRGAKDVAALGHVFFESIAGDGRYHKCEITPYLEFVLHPSEDISTAHRDAIGIPSGTGTLVTIQLDKTQTVPQHSTLEEKLQQFVSLRAILRDEHRTVSLRDTGSKAEAVLRSPHVEGHERVKELLEIPGYPGVTAKLTLCRASRPFETEGPRFRLGGVLVESRRAVHEATLFDSSLETNPFALRFYGRLVCPFIDELCNQFDEGFELRTGSGKDNPTYVLDPSRRSGLVREHPFVRALFGEALKRLRPLVAEEQRREENERAEVESSATRKRLNALEKAAIKFLEQFENDDDTARDPDGKSAESRFLERGFALSPPFCQMVVGHSRQFWLTIRQETFPELESGSNVQIECLSGDIISSTRYCGLEPHPTRDGVLRAIWKVRAVSSTPATGVRVRVGSIVAEAYVEVLNSEADAYRDVSTLMFRKKQYTMRTDQASKRLIILAPLSAVPTVTPLEVTVDSPHFRVSGELVLKPRKDLGVSICEFVVKTDGSEAMAAVLARLGKVEASASVVSHRPVGADLSIKLVDMDYGSQRYKWEKNVLKIAARHPSLKRYLGPKEDGFPGQETLHFRVLLAEIVSEALCAMAVRRSVQANPEDYEVADWDRYYFEYTKLMAEFLPVAHSTQEVQK
jgi:hypothetical protein